MKSMIFHLLLLMCVFRPSEQAPKVIKELSKLSCEEINILLDYHNDRRNFVASGQAGIPPAKNMWVLKWDDDLAKVAQEYSLKCDFNHNKKRPKNTGENLSFKAKSEKFTPDVKRLAGFWYNEIKYYDPNGERNITLVGHFTQMMWGETKFVGCGISFYEDPSHQPNPFQTLLVCNYRPGGNNPHKKVYTDFQEPRCDPDFGVKSKLFTSLCAHDQDHADGKYSPCSGFKLQPTAIFFVIVLLYYYF